MNETISKWFYGPIMHSKSTFDIDKLMYQDVNGPESWRWVDCADYENDESAWTQELYGRIEEAGLADAFGPWLYTILRDESEITCIGVNLTVQSAMMWYMLKTTPAQKASALSRAIEEVA